MYFSARASRSSGHRTPSTMSNGRLKAATNRVRTRLVLLAFFCRSPLTLWCILLLPQFAMTSFIHSATVLCQVLGLYGMWSEFRGATGSGQRSTSCLLCKHLGHSEIRWFSTLTWGNYSKSCSLFVWSTDFGLWDLQYCLTGKLDVDQHHWASSRCAGRKQLCY